MFALFAGVQGETAFRALADGIGEILQQGAAFGAAGDGARSRHVDGARAERYFLSLALGADDLSNSFFAPPPESWYPCWRYLRSDKSASWRMTHRRLIVRFWRSRHKSFFEAGFAR